MDEEIQRLRTALYVAEGRLWVTECRVDHREKETIQAINAVRVAIYAVLGWDVTIGQNGLMVAAKKQTTERRLTIRRK